MIHSPQAHSPTLRHPCFPGTRFDHHTAFGPRRRPAVLSPIRIIWGVSKSYSRSVHSRKFWFIWPRRAQGWVFYASSSPGGPNVYVGLTVTARWATHNEPSAGDGGLHRGGCGIRLANRDTRGKPAGSLKGLKSSARTAHGKYMANVTSFPRVKHTGSLVTHTCDLI